MTQHNRSTNWVFQDPNGQPQIIKLVQTDGKQIGGVMTSALSGPALKLLKAQQSQDEPQIPGTQIIKLANGSKLLSKVPTVRYARGSEGRVVQKAVRVAPSQLQTLKLVTSTQKIQPFQPITQSLLKHPPLVPKIEPKYISPPILDHTGIRKRHDLVDSDYAPEYKRRKTEKVGKGLRHFSMKVCEKVRRKGTTSYNEVADELVEEFTSSLNNSATDQQYDQKNIRRRVYDALNVLMAMNIISKEKKEIRWLGLPTNSVQECIQLEREKQSRIQSIQEKTAKLQNLVLNQIAFKNLAQRNRNFEMEYGPPHPNSFIEMPFVIINTHKDTIVDCSISNDKMEYLFNFTDKFQIHEDAYVLHQIGLSMGLNNGECTPENLEKIKSMVPTSLEEYVDQLYNTVPDEQVQLIEPPSPGPSSLLSSEDLGEEENSLQSSSFDPLSPNKDHDFSDDEDMMSDMSSDIETN